MNLKLERLHEYVLPTVATLAGMGLAIYCGKLTGQGQMGILSILLTGSIIMTALLLMRESIWLLVPVTWSFAGQIPVLPLPFAVRDLVAMAVFGCFLVLKALKKVHRKPETTTTDLWMLLMLVYLVTVFIRNPVGVQALGSVKIGGRPYYNVFVGCIVYWTLSRASLKEWQARLLPIFIVAGQTLDGLLNFVVIKFPQTAPVITNFYTGVSVAAYEAQDVWRGLAGESTGRRMYLASIGLPIAYLLMAFNRPLQLINPLNVSRFLAFAAAVVLVALSGFRSFIVAVMMSFVINSYLKRGWTDVIRATAIGIPVLALLVAMQGFVFDLPLSIQRTLSFLPGRWDYIAVAEAKGSSQWRFEMWKQMLFTDKYIDSKWLGDGFGYTRREFDVMKAMDTHGVGAEQFQVNTMIGGGVHSGPISAIRYVGYVGLGIYLVVLSALARDSWRLIRKAQNTQFFPLALFIGTPMVWEPLNFVFIVGGYEGSLPLSIYWLGLLKMLRNSLNEAESTPQTTPVPLLKNGPRRRLEPALAGRV